MSKTSKPKLLLIDGSNLCFREFYSKKNLTHKGKCVDVLYGVFRSFIALSKQYPDHFRIIAWEGGYERRLRESTAGVEAGLIPEPYKENRRRNAAESQDPDIESLFEQMDELKDHAIPLTKTLQVKVKGYEADDVINSYADYVRRHGGEAVIVSTDLDFYQCLSREVTIYNPRDQDTWSLDRFKLEFGYEPYLWVDRGAIEGEIGKTKDNIFGIDGWGPVTAHKYVLQHGDCDSILAALKSMPKLSKKEEKFIEQYDRLKLAKSLKMMDIVPDLPMPRVLHKLSEADLRQYFISFGFASLLREASRLV